MSTKTATPKKKRRKKPKANQRNVHPLWLSHNVTLSEGQNMIRSYLGPGPYKGAARLDARTRWIIVRFMEAKLESRIGLTHHDRASKLGVTDQVYRDWRRGAEAFQNKAPDMVLPDKVCPRNPYNVRAGTVDEPEVKPEDDPKSPESGPPMTDAEVAKFRAAGCWPKIADADPVLEPKTEAEFREPEIDTTEGPISLVYLDDVSVYGLTVDTAAALILKLRQG